MQTITEQTDAFVKRAEQVREAANPTVADAYIAGKVSEFRSKASYLNGDVMPAESLQRAESLEREMYDALLRESVEVLDKQERELARAIQARMGAAAECPQEPALQVQNDSVRLIAELLRNQQRDAAERQLTGKTLAYVARLHAETADSANPELVRLIEQQQARGWSDITLQADEKDAEALLRLRKQIADRRSARIATHDPEALKLSERLASVQRSAVLDLLRRHVRDGRGVAKRRNHPTVQLPVIA